MEVTPGADPARERDHTGVVFRLAAVLAFFVLLAMGSWATFRVDDWNLIAHRSLTDPETLLTPFNEQLIAVPAALFRAIFAVVGLHSYLPYLAVLVGLHVAGAAAVRSFVARLAGPIAGLAAGVVFLFLGSGYENLNAAFQLTQVIATAAGVVALSLVEERRPALASVLLLISLASHAVGGAYLAAAIVAQALADRRGLLWFAMPIVIIGAWALFLDLPTFAGREESASEAIGAIPVFVMAGPAAAAGAVFGLGALGGLLILAVTVGLLVPFRIRPVRPWLVIAAAVGLLSEYALIALSRASFGWHAVEWSRYVYSAVPFVFVVAAAWVGPLEARVPLRRRTMRLVVAALAIEAVLGNLRIYAASIDPERAYTDRVRAAAIIASGRPDALPLTSDPQMPGPAALRGLFERAGSPARDDLFPGVVPPLRNAAVAEACREMLPQSPIEACVAIVARRIAVEESSPAP